MSDDDDDTNNYQGLVDEEKREALAHRKAALTADPSCKKCGTDISWNFYARYPHPDKPKGPRVYCIDCWQEIGYRPLRVVPDVQRCPHGNEVGQCSECM